jgi:outer membrane protein TolC
MRRPFFFSRLALAAVLTAGGAVAQQRPAVPPALPELPPLPPPLTGAESIPLAQADAADRVLPINLATALHLANARPLDVQIAARQVTIAARQLDRAKLAWVPDLVAGVNYFRHEGGQQNFAGDIIRSSRGAFAVGVGPNVVFNLSDAIHGPLVAKQDLRARRAQRQAVANDTTLAVAEAYFWVQQARGELAGAAVALAKAEEVAGKVELLAGGLAPPLEASRAKVELARRQQAATTARERWRLASADLVRLLRLEPGTLVEPIEPPFLTVAVIDPQANIDSLIPIGLTNRPELAAHQAVVQAAIARLKQEKLRPLVPSLALRGASTNPAGSLGWAGFGGGPNDQLNGFGSRFDLDLQILWEFQSLGFGNKARVGERRAEQEAATLELFRAQDRVAAEVSTAHAQVTAAGERLAQSEPALKSALELVEKSLTGMTQTRRIGNATTLIVRPQEVVAAVQALGQANADYYAAVGDYNRAQFRLYRALGHPAHGLAGAVPQVGEATEVEAPPPAVPAIRRPQPVSVYPPNVPPVLVAPPGRAVPSPPTELPVPLTTRPAVPSDPLPPPVAAAAGDRMSPWDLPITRHLLEARRDAADVQQVAHRAPTPTPAPPTPVAPGGIPWQPIAHDTKSEAPAPLKLAAPGVPLPTTPAKEPAPPAAPLPPPTPKADDIQWETIRPGPPAKRKYESLFR